METELDPTKCYTVTILADANGGDMLIYATKLWPGDISGVKEHTVRNSMDKNAYYNLKGQRVDNTYRGLVIQSGRKMLRR